MKCLEKERNNRYASADHVAEELRRFLAGEPVLARPTTMLKRLRRWYRRHSQIVAGTFTVVVFAVMLVTHVVSFGIAQFMVRSPTRAELLASIGPNVLSVLLALAYIAMGIATIRGSSRGLWMSLIAFAVMAVAMCYWFYWSIVIARELSNVPIYSLSVINPQTPELRNAYIRNCVIGYTWYGVSWAFVGLALQVHALWIQETGQHLDMVRRR
jgi:hypothetical protein